MKKLQDLFSQAKQAFHSFTASRTRVAVALAFIAALVGAILLLPPPSSTELQAGPVQTVETANDASTVVIDLPAPSSTTDSAVVAVDAAPADVATDAVVDATLDDQPLPEETCAQ